MDREDLTERLILESKLEGSNGASYADVWRQTSRQGPEDRAGSAVMRKQWETSVPEQQKCGGEGRGNKIREQGSPKRGFRRPGMDLKGNQDLSRAFSWSD